MVYGRNSTNDPTLVSVWWTTWAPDPIFVFFLLASFQRSSPPKSTRRVVTKLGRKDVLERLLQIIHYRLRLDKQHGHQTQSLICIRQFSKIFFSETFWRILTKLYGRTSTNDPPLVLPESFFDFYSQVFKNFSVHYEILLTLQDWWQQYFLVSA